MEHLGGYLVGGDPNTYMPDVWKELIRIDRIKSVLDVGCGTGENLKWFMGRGMRAVGIEGHPDAVRVAEANGIEVIRHDYTTGAFHYINDFDLGICTEFAEHVDQRHENNWLITLVACRAVLFTHGLPGQGGYHHVNCQTNKYWIDRFAEYGFRVDQEFTDRHRDASAVWGRNTLTLFRAIPD